MKIRAYLFLLILLFFVGNANAEDKVGFPVKNDTTVVGLQETKAHKNFGQVLLSPFKWLAKNWSTHDSRYVTPTFYNWVFQLQNTTSAEWMSLDNRLVKVNMRSDFSNRLGP